MRLSDLFQACCDKHESTISEDTGAGSLGSIRFSDLHARATCLADALAGAGLRPGHVVGLVAQNGIAWVVWDLAAAMLNAVVKAFPADFDIGDAEVFMQRHGLALLASDHPDAGRARGHMRI